MAGKSQGKPWKQFEKLVAEFERHLNPKGANVTLDDKVPDLITGHLRQVDATIRQIVKGEKILIAIECRKRGQREDITWIEQLYAKKSFIGATQIVGVSSTGFSDYALKRARISGIVLRKIDKIDPETFMDQYILNVKASRLHSGVAKFKFSNATSSQLEYFQRKLQLQGTKKEERIFNFKYYNGPHTLRSFYEIFLEKGYPSLQKSPAFDHVSMEIAIPPEEVYIRTPSGILYMERFGMNFDHIQAETVVDNPTKYEYKDDENNIISTIVEFEYLDLDGESVKYHHFPESNS